MESLATVRAGRRAASASGLRCSRQSWAMFLGILLPGILFPISPSRGELLLNEILYDPDGPDAGREWVELQNTGPWPAPADGLVLEFANGASPGAWEVVWRGEEGEWIEAGAYFLVGERKDGPVDSEARLGLQNGPDALRLVRDAFVLDLVGWGEPLAPSLSEGPPAAPTSLGSSLARDDGVDTDDNRADFRSRRPTPGRANFPAIDLALALLPDGGRLFPVDPGAPRLRVRVQLENLGREAARLSEADCTLSGNRVLLPDELLAPGARVSVPAVAFCLLRGDDALVAGQLRFPGDEDAGSDVDTLALAIAPSPIQLTEIHPRPLAPAVEWIEIEAREPTRLAGWRIEDASGTRVTVLPEDSLLAGTFVLSAPGGDGTVHSEGWPTLNDRASNLGVADTLFVIDPAGRIRDWAVYGESDPGISWIRIPGPPLADPRDLWLPDTARPGGTPGTRSGGEEVGSLWPLSGGVSLSSHPAGAWIDLPRGSRSYALDVYDLRGRRVRRASGPVRGERIRWDGRDSGGDPVVGGVYLLDLRAETENGAHRERKTLVLGR